MRSSFVRVFCALMLALVLGGGVFAALPASPAKAAGTTTITRCWSGTSYGFDRTQKHNYVEFQVGRVSAGFGKDWYTTSPWWATLKASLWAWPDGNGMARAGLSPGDYIPPWSASNYQICGKFVVTTA